MGIYIYRLNQPKKIAGTMIGTMKYWDKLSMGFGVEQRPLYKPAYDLPPGQIYVEYEDKFTHGSHLVKDLLGGHNYWNDTNAARFSDTGLHLVKYGHRWEIVNDYVSLTIKVDLDYTNTEYLVFEVHNGTLLVNSKDTYYGELNYGWGVASLDQREILADAYATALDEAGSGMYTVPRKEAFDSLFLKANVLKQLTT